ncbi:MAG: hypothetical protein CMC96_12570 [Flavobacteriales bacterium]|nr:hypothetical protein [Flavobacteriales bacterium]|tara:strand:- start:38554 stop:39735 length:1182 start_codon:yes stop_codon:yes gene_type:complete
MRFLFIALLLLSISACSVFNSTSKNELGISTKQLKKTTILVDVGRESGTMFDEGVFANSFESVAKVLKENKGVKIDLQISKDSTLWLISENEIRDCLHQNYKGLSEYDDEEINISSICWYEKQLIPLDTLVKLLDSASYKEKAISLNLIDFNNNKPITLFGGEKGLARIIAEKLEVLNRLEEIEFIAEVPSLEGILAFEKYSSITPYLRLTEQSKKHNYDRLSIPFVKQSRVKANKEFQIWGANIADQIIETLKLEPDYIQTTDFKLANFIKESSNLQSTTIENDSLLIKNSDTLFTAILTEEHIKSDFILELTIQGEGELLNTSYTIHGYNSDKHEILWQGTTLQSSKKKYRTFFNSSDLKERDCKEIRIVVQGKQTPSSLLTKIKLYQVSQ